MHGLHGDATWGRSKAGRCRPSKYSYAWIPYPDDITYRLIGAASGFRQPPGTLLRAFGEYWTLYTGSEGYNAYSMPQAVACRRQLTNLNDLHVRVGLMYPQLKPPSFRCTDVTAKGLVLHYFSDVPDLPLMVIGLVEDWASALASNSKSSG